METELSFGQTTFLLWVPPFLSYELWKQRIELSKNSIQTAPNYPVGTRVCFSFTFMRVIYFLNKPIELEL